MKVMGIPLITMPLCDLILKIGAINDHNNIVYFRKKLKHVYAFKKYSLLLGMFGFTDFNYRHL